MAALKRAALKAHRRAIETSGAVAIVKDGKVVYVSEIPGLDEDEVKRD